MKVPVKLVREVHPEASTLITDSGEAEPGLLDLGESVPSGDEARADRAGCGLVSQKTKVADDSVMQLSVLGIRAVEEEERINEQGEVVDERDVEGSGGLKVFR